MDAPRAFLQAGRLSSRHLASRHLIVTRNNWSIAGKHLNETRTAAPGGDAGPKSAPNLTEFGALDSNSPGCFSLDHDRPSFSTPSRWDMSNLQWNGLQTTLQAGTALSRLYETA